MSIKKVYCIEGLDCANCAAKIERAINELDEISTSTIDFMGNKAYFEAQSQKLLDVGIKKSLKLISSIEPDTKLVEQKQDKENNKLSEHYKTFIELGACIILLIIASILSKSDSVPNVVTIILYAAAYVCVAGEILIKVVKNISKGTIFDENFLMAVATIGAFSIGQYAEGVAVMLFYQIGELFQSYAVNKSRKSISELMDIRPDYANLKQGDTSKRVSPDEILIGDEILVKPGEKIPLDGIITSGTAFIDTSALTGESVPRSVKTGDEVMSGCMNTSGLLSIKVTKKFGDSTVSKILNLVENASSKKASTENFITKFARYYTPIVVFAAVLLAVIPPVFISGEVFTIWLYRALTFLVISCPCALVISIPLSFFGGIGGASRQGILIKGSNYLEALSKVSTVAFDKTGTLTKGVFKVSEINPIGIPTSEFLQLVALGECNSNHPIAKSVLAAYGKEPDKSQITSFEELSGHGIKATVLNKEILLGNAKLMQEYGIEVKTPSRIGTVVHVAVNGIYGGYVLIADEIKADAKAAVEQLQKLGVTNTVMFTGDSKSVGDSVAAEIGLTRSVSNMMPQDKVAEIESLIKNSKPNQNVAFVGDGINDAPVLARADIGIAMGGVGSDAAIEAADVVIMTDEPSKVAAAILHSKRTLVIVKENIWFALGIKAIVLVLGAVGIASMWAAVFADVGVCIIAILNAVRTLKITKKY